MTEAITLTESSRFVALEAIVERGQSAWLEVGLALTEIKERKLYRSDFATFREYCQERWGWTDKRAYQLIDAADEVSTAGRTFDNEREARAARKERTQPTKPAAPSHIDELESNEEETPHIVQHTPEEVLTEVASHVEPRVTEYYEKLERVMFDAINNATDKQLASMGVYAALLPKIIKDELNRRK